MKVTVLVRFKDKYKPGVYYNPGDLIEIEDSERLEDLINRKPEALVELVQEAEVINTVDLNQSVIKIKELIAELKDVSILRNSLLKEKDSEKPRKGVIQAIEDRISEL